jgi:hypothetical protein
MNESPQIGVNSSSIIDLKAELYRKQESFRLKKLSQSQQQFVNNDNNLYSINNNSNNDKKYKLGKRIREKVAKTGLKFNDRINSKLEENQLNEEKIEEEKALKKSRDMLEIKTKLYDKYSNDINLCLNKEDEEFDDRILVNFQQKAIDQQIRNDLIDKNEDLRHLSVKNDLINKNEDLSHLSLNNETNSEEEWTEFVDSLGRSRKCLKKDLQYFIDIDKKSFHKNDDKNELKSVNDLSNNISTFPHLSKNSELLSNDLIRELDRREWETNASNEMNSGNDGQQSDGQIHYQNVQFNEIRDHGVAYYSFSKDSQQREEQMDLLNKLREQTKNQKIAKQKLKEKRKLLMRERLAKIAQRKGISIDFTQSSDSEEETQPEPLPQEKPPISKPIKVREWDIGKEELMSELPKFKSNTYFEEKRDERNPEFAPPSSYSRNQFSGNFVDNRSHYKRQKLKNEKMASNPENMNINNKSKPFDDNKTSNTFSTPKSDVNQIISNALSFFRNNSK